MNAFIYRNRSLCVEKVPLSELADQFGTPLYVYSRNALRDGLQSLKKAMRPVSPLICYSVKANSNISVLATFIREGAGLDIVSGGELYRAVTAGADPRKIVFAGVGKTSDEISYALEQNILFFTVESEPEAARISECAQRLHKTARIAFRINPDVDPKTHRHITTGTRENKFGLDHRRVIAACKVAAALPCIEIAGVHMHIGSQILSPRPFAQAVARVTRLCSELRKLYPTLRYLDIGGGIGIRYHEDQAPLDPADYARILVPALKKTGLKIVLEPGRFLVGNAGALVCRVQYVKNNAAKKFVIVDAGMNDLIRPSLYDAYHQVLPVRMTDGTIKGDLVGPICESGDFFAKNRKLPAMAQNDLVAIMSAGAYGFSMSSNYNSRPRAAEVMVDGKNVHLIRERETWEDMVSSERLVR